MFLVNRNSVSLLKYSKMKFFSLFFAVLLMNFYIHGQDTISLGSPQVFSEYVGSVSAYSQTFLSSDRFVVAYYKGGSWDGKIRIGKINNDSTIKFEFQRTFSTESIKRVEVTQLSDSKFILIHRSNVFTQINICEVSDNSITIGTPYTLFNSSFGEFSLAKINEKSFVIAYYDPSPGYGKAVLGNIDESFNISLNPAVNFSSSTITNLSYLSVDRLSASKFVIAYGYDWGKVIIGSIDNTGMITFGSAEKFSEKESYEMDIVVFDSTKFAIAYSSEYTNSIGTAILGNVNGNDSMTFSKEFTFNNYKTRGLKAAKLSNDEMIIGYNNRDGDENAYLLLAKTSEDSIAFSHQTMHNDDVGLNTVNHVSSRDDHKFMVLYITESDNKGYVRLGRTKGFSTPIIDQNELSRYYNIFPNPVKGNLSITSSINIQDAVFKLIDLQGRTLRTEQINAGTSIYDFSKYPKGLYLVQIISDKGSIAKTILIE